MPRATVLLALMLSACTGSPTASPPSNLGFANGTNLTVSLVVNGQHVMDVGPATVVPTVDPASLPPRPWTVEARSSRGTVLATMMVAAVTSPGDYRSDFDRVCGRLTMWIGETEPPAPEGTVGPGTPGDCGP